MAKIKQIHRSKSEREYIRTLIHNLSLQRFTDYEIAEYLKEEKGIKISRTAVNTMRNNLEKSAENWYIDLRQSRYKYIAAYKERIDALLSYQRKLNLIVSRFLNPPVKMLYPDTVIRAIAELHRIEISIFNLWKQLPNLDITEKTNNDNSIDNNNRRIGYGEGIDGLEIEPWDDPKWLQCDVCGHWWRTQELLDAHKIRESGAENPPDDLESIEWSGWTQCDSCRRWWEREDLMKAHKIRSKGTPCQIPNVV